MNEEERKAIEELEKLIKGPCETCKYCEGAYKLNRKNIIQLLNLTKKLQKENEEWQRAYQEEKDRQFDLIRKSQEKDKIIDLMAERVVLTKKEWEHIEKRKILRKDFELKKEIKNYFEKRVKNSTKCT